MSIKQYTMNNLLENQKIRKRKSYGALGLNGPAGLPVGNLRKNSPNPEFCVRTSESLKRKSGRKPAFRPAGVISLFEYNSKLIEGVRQHPTRPNHRKQNLAQSSFSRFSLLKGKENSARTLRGPAESGKVGRFFSLLASSAIPVSALFLLIVGVLFVMYGKAGSFDWMDREVIGSEKDLGSEYNLALYAGIHPKENQPESLNENSGDIIPLDLLETFAWQNYKVKKGDSVSKIAAAFSVSMDAIIASNNITNARSLREGAVLKIPNMDGIPYTVKKGDSLSGISQAKGVPLEAILDANDIQNDKITVGMNLFIPGARMQREDLKLALGELFIYPLRGAKLSSPFGWRNDPFTGVRSYHAAVDLSAPQGTVIKAAMDGKVSALGNNATYGNYIILSHPGGYQTMYAHLHSFTVKKGAELGQGVQIGTVGNTGYSTGPHLHFAIFKNGRAVNPLDFLNSQK